MGRITLIPRGTAASQRRDAFDLVSHLVRKVATAYLYRIRIWYKCVLCPGLGSGKFSLTMRHDFAIVSARVHDPDG